MDDCIMLPTAKQHHPILYNILIVMIHSQSMSLTQKKRLWKEKKEEDFKQMAGEDCAIFNYFYQNNDLFRMIKPNDYLLYYQKIMYMTDVEANIFAGALVTVLLADWVILKRLAPNFRFKEWRLTAWLMKLVVWPYALFRIGDYYLLQDKRKELFDIQQKYRFGFEDYVQANRIFDRALEVNRLEELLEKRTEFDWEGVPQLPQ